MGASTRSVRVQASCWHSARARAPAINAALEVEALVFAGLANGLAPASIRRGLPVDGARGSTRRYADPGARTRRGAPLGAPRLRQGPVPVLHVLLSA